MKGITGRIGKNTNGYYCIALNDGQTEWLWAGDFLLEDVIMSIPALLEEYPNLENRQKFERIFEIKTL